MKTTKKTRVRDQKTHRHTFRLNDEQQARFLSMWERSGTKNKSKFILGRLFGWKFTVVQKNKEAHDYYLRLTNLNAQIRVIGVNYNQTVKAVHTNFGDRRAVMLLARLEKSTQELAVLCAEVIRLTEEFNRRWSVE